MNVDLGIVIDKCMHAVLQVEIYNSFTDLTVQDITSGWCDTDEDKLLVH